MAHRHDFLTVAEAASRLKLTEDTIRRWCQSGKLSATLLSRRAGYRIPISAVDRILGSETTSKALGGSAEDTADSLLKPE